MDEATKKHVEELVAMPFGTFPDVCVAWKEETGGDFSEVAQTLRPVHQYVMQRAGVLMLPVTPNYVPYMKNRCVPRADRTAWIRFHASQGTYRWYPVGIPRKTGVRRPVSVQHSRRGDAVKKQFGSSNISDELTYLGIW